MREVKNGRRGTRSDRDNKRGNTEETNERLSELPTAAPSAVLFDDPAFAELCQAWQAADSETRVDILKAVRLLVGSHC
jgi:hypothetical protein